MCHPLKSPSSSHSEFPFAFGSVSGFLCSVSWPVYLGGIPWTLMAEAFYDFNIWKKFLPWCFFLPGVTCLFFQINGSFKFRKIPLQCNVGMILNMYSNFGRTYIHFSVFRFYVQESVPSVRLLFFFFSIPSEESHRFLHWGPARSCYSWIFAVVNGVLCHYICWLV